MAGKTAHLTSWWVSFRGKTWSQSLLLVDGDVEGGYWVSDCIVGVVGRCCDWLGLEMGGRWEMRRCLIVEEL